MNNNFARTKGVLFLLIVSVAGILASCTEKLSVVGSDFLHDTISRGVHSYSDSNVVAFQPIDKRAITISYGLHVALNASAPELFFGKVNNDIEMWAAMKLPIVPPSLGSILSDTLYLRMKSPYPYHYGAENDQVVDFAVWTELGNLVNDSTTSLPLGLQDVIGSYQGTLMKDSILKIAIPLDTAVLNRNLRTSSLALVIKPNDAMNTIRWFASNENGDSTFAPTLKLFTQTATDTASVYLHPTIDFHIVGKEQTVVPPGEFMLRGSYAKRERIVVRIDSIKAQLKLTPFATINSGVLQIRSDKNFRKVSNVPLDSIGPSLIYIPNPTVSDSAQSFVAYGTSPAADPDLYGFQIRTLIENSLRSGVDSLVFELCSGFAFHYFKGSYAGAEDYNIDRWMFYGPDYGSTPVDIDKRPKLVVTYSYLR
ncbi:MAG: hypothetical protein ABI778_07580 [Ignavibacteriota bacterium]